MQKPTAVELHRILKENRSHSVKAVVERKVDNNNNSTVTQVNYTEASNSSTNSSSNKSSSSQSRQSNSGGTHQTYVSLSLDCYEKIWHY